MKCPNCGSSNVSRERRINGNDQCRDCGVVWPSRYSEEERKPSSSPALSAPYDPECKVVFESYQAVANQIWSDKSNLEKEVEMLREQNKQYRAAHKHLSAVDHRAIGDIMIENSELKKELQALKGKYSIEYPWNKVQSTRAFWDSEANSGQGKEVLKTHTVKQSLQNMAGIKFEDGLRLLTDSLLMVIEYIENMKNQDLNK